MLADSWNVRRLTEHDRDQVERLLSLDPVAAVYIRSRVENGLLSGLGPGQLWGFPAANPTSLLQVGTNVVPYRTDAESRASFVEKLGSWRPSAALVGPTTEVVPLWRALSDRWGAVWSRTRIIRWAQPVMMTSQSPQIVPDARVERTTVAHFDSFFAAAVAMYTEELQESPLVNSPSSYRHHVWRSVMKGSSFSIVEDGQVIFKADIGTSAGGVAQIQGVWVRPDYRGRGLAAPAMAAVTNLVLQDHEAVSLYVNDFNFPAIATYLRCGYVRCGQNTTVLY